MTFRLNYFIAMVLLFFIEVAIALFIHDDFIRPYVGDILVVILIYSFVRAFFKVNVGFAAFGVLLFSFAIELLQYFNFVAILGLEKSQLARTVLGSSFSWWDILCYTIGTVLIFVFEELRLKSKKNLGIT